MAKYTCCTGQTECNHIITIGYLKSFIGNNIKTTGGTIVNVNTSEPDSYVPTYSELTNGSMLPLFVDGGSGKWHDNVDGIIINGSYVSDQNVKQEDLELVYTSFKNLSISASKTSFSECFDSTDICATYTLTKTVKSMNGSCTTSDASTDGADTSCNPSFSASCEWISIGNCSNNCVTITAGKNGSWSASSRSCTITANVNYKGETHSSNNITIVQNALTGGYYVRNFKERAYDGVSITNHSPQYYGCDGGNFSVTAIGSYHDLYMWEDSCGIIYDKTPYSSITGTELAGNKSGVFNEIVCPTEHETNQTTLTINYHGYSDSVSFYQNCTQTCQCGNVTSCTRTCSATSTVDVCGGDVSLSGTQICDVDVYGWDSSGRCVYISSTTETRNISTVVTIGPNTTQQPKTYTGTKDYIDYTITQPAGPCGGCTGETASTVWGSYEISCESATTLTINVPYSSVTEYGNCKTVIEPHTSAITLTNITCNSGGVKVIRETNPRITQAGGCQCCDCDDLTLGSNPSNWAWNDRTAKTVPFTANSACITNITASPSGDTWFTASIVGNTVSVAPTGDNTTTTPKEATIKVSYKSDGTDCYKTFPVEQNPYGCSCGDLTMGATAVTWSAWNDTVAKTVSYTANSACITDISVSSNNTWFTPTLGTNSISITPSGQNTTLTAKTGTVIVNYKSNGVSCSGTVSVTQPAYVCACEDLTLGNPPSNWAWNETAAKTVSFTANSICITNITASTSGDTWFTASIVGNSISIAPTGQNSTTTAKTDYIIVSYKTNGVDCSQQIPVQQNPYGCSCGDLSMGATAVTWSAWDDTAAKTVSYTANSACITDISVTSDTAWFTATLGANSISITPSGNNMTLTAKTGTVTINYKSNGTSCSGTVSVTQPAYVCSCNDLTLGSNPSNWAWNDRTAKTVPFTANSVCITNITASSSTSSFTASIVGNSVSIIPTGQNTTTVIKEANIIVSYKTNGVDCSQQIPVKQNPYGCSCGDLSMGATAVTWSAWDDTAAKTVSYTANSECITDVSVSSNNAWFTVSVNTSTNIVTITPSGQNTTLTAKTGIVTISYKSNGNNCSATVDVLQPAYVCTCNDLEVGNPPSNWAWDETASKTVPFTANSVCITNITASSSTNWFTASIVGNNVSIAPSGQNSTATAKTATVTVSYKTNGVDCNKTIPVEQNPYGCSCGDLTMGATAVTWSAWDDTVTKAISYTANSECITDVNVNSSNNWFIVTLGANSISITPSGNNTTLTAKTGVITISYKSNGTNCSKSIDVLQPAYVCTCNDLEVGNPPSNWVWNDTTTKAVPFTANSACITNINASTNDNWFTASIAGNSVLIAPTGNNTTTIIKEATVTVSYKTNGSDCNKTIPVKQNPYGCSCGDLSMGATAVTWSAWDDTAAKTVSYTANSTCITDVSVNSSNNWFAVTLGSNSISITPSGNNTTLTAKTGIVTISYKSNGNNCSATVDVLQPAYVCACSDLTLGSDPSSWEWNDIASKTVPFTANSECISVTSVSSSTNWFSASIVGNNVSIAPTGQNTTDSAKTGTVLLRYSSNGVGCSATVEVRQEAYVCSCDNLTLTANTIACGSASTAIIGMYNSNTCVTDLNGTSNQSWIKDIAFNNGNIYATIEANPDELTRSASITINCNANGSACAAKTMIVSQLEKCCDCDDFNVNTTPIKFAKELSSSTESISYTATSCMNVTASVVTSVTGLVLSISSVVNGVVTVSMTNTSYHIQSIDTKIGTVTVTASYTENGSTITCSSNTVDVYIEGNCSMYTLTSENTVNCSGGTITFNFS